MNSSYAIAGVFLLASLSAPAFAGGVPAAAMNKTITVSFAATGNAKSADGQVKGFSTQVSRIIYVSSAGRAVHAPPGHAGLQQPGRRL